MELTIDRLTKQFGASIAVDRVSATLRPGVYGLLGANGAGKTTLMRMLCDVLKPTSGSVLYDGVDIAALGADYRALLGYLPQDFGYYPDFTALDFMRYLASLKGMDRARAVSYTHLDVYKRQHERHPMRGAASQRQRRVRQQLQVRVGVGHGRLQSGRIDHAVLPLLALLAEQRVVKNRLCPNFANHERSRPFGFIDPNQSARFSVSMADIAFLLLIFFLVATTMNVDTGLVRVLPPMPDPNVKQALLSTCRWSVDSPLITTL